MERSEFFKMARKIYTRNDARPALIGMTLPAKRLLFMCLAQLERDSNKKNVIIKFDSEKIFTVTVKDYAELCGIDYSLAYKQIVDGVKGLRGYVLEAKQGLLKKRNEDLPSDFIEPFTIADSGTGYSKGKGFARVKFAKEMEPLISNLTGDFTGQFLLSAMQLPDGNSGKLYLILREWISSGFLFDRTITVDEFKLVLAVDKHKSYRLFTEFNNSFFKRAVKKVIEKTEFTSIKMELVERRSRKAYKVKISYTYDQKAMKKRNEIVKDSLGKDDLNQYECNKSPEVSLFFLEANHYLTKSEAEHKKLNWSDGLTAEEVLSRLKSVNLD